MMNTLNRQQFNQPEYTTRILQFGEGNFLRGFVDWQIDQLNESTDLDAGIVIVRPIDTNFPALMNEQDGLYTSVIRGINEQNEPVEETRIISSVNKEIPLYQNYDAYLNLAKDPNIKFVFSNTTEAGIAFCADDLLGDIPPSSYPAKLTQWLYSRFKAFDGDMDKGLFIIPCELIDYNGEKLKEVIEQYCALWSLDESFVHWVKKANTFCSTLVDRIVTGHPREELPELEKKVGYHDQFMVTAEYFYLFVIQGPKSLGEALKLDGQNLNIKIVDDIKPYKERKVAILNGAHTAMVPVAYLYGLNTVGEAMNDKVIRRFIETLIDSEVIPALSLSRQELDAFSKDVLKRFSNPYIKHQLTSIALNSMTKWTTRLLPQLLNHAQREGQAPNLMSLALAAQFLFYNGTRGVESIELIDDAKWLSFFSESWAKVDSGQLSIAELVQLILADEVHWGLDLNTVPALHDQVSGYLELMRDKGMAEVLSQQVGA